MTRREWSPGVLVVIVIGCLALAGCGADDISFKDSKIVDKLGLKKSEGGYAVDGDPFCEVKPKLLTDSDQVSEAADKDKLGLVITSREGNVGVIGVPVFAPDCRDKVKKKLNKLDPVPKE